MNWEPTIAWASAALWHLNPPDSASGRNLSRERLEEKLGWLRDFVDGLARWPACLAVISTTLTFLNQRGLFECSVKAYQPVVADIATCPATNTSSPT